MGTTDFVVLCALALAVVLTLAWGASAWREAGPRRRDDR